MNKVVTMKMPTMIAMNTKLSVHEQRTIRMLRASGYHDSAISGMTGYCRATINKYAGKMPDVNRRNYNIEHRLMRTSRYFTDVVEEASVVNNIVTMPAQKKVNEA